MNAVDERRTASGCSTTQSAARVPRAGTPPSLQTLRDESALFVGESGVVKSEIAVVPQGRLVQQQPRAGDRQGAGQLAVSSTVGTDNGEDSAANSDGGGNRAGAVRVLTRRGIFAVPIAYSWA